MDLVGTPHPHKKHMLCFREMPMPAEPEANRDPCREGNEGVVNAEVKFR